MAIDTSTINQLISDFRALSQKDSISPESLGILLKQLADLISSAAADGDFSSISNALNNVPTALVSIAQGSADSNDILMDITTSNLVDGVQSSEKDVVFIRQATTERAGAMRAQQVKDLNSTRSGLDSLQKIVSTLSEMVNQLQTSVSTNSEQLTNLKEVADYCSESIADLSENLQVAIDNLDSLQQTVDANINDIDSIKEKTDCPRIAAEVKGGKLLIRNYKYYIDNGYYAYVFRFTSKRNKAKFSVYPDYKRTDKNKGWHVIGGYTKNITFNIFSVAHFRAEDFMNWHWKGTEVIKYSPEAKYLIGAKRSGLNMYVPWGKKKVKVANQNGFYMMRRFRFAIGFGREYNRNYDNLSPAQLASNLAEFSVIFDPVTKDFHFGK